MYTNGRVTVDNLSEISSFTARPRPPRGKRKKRTEQLMRLVIKQNMASDKCRIPA